MEKFIAIGDIHGRADLLDLLLHKIKFHGLLTGVTPHRLVFLGDMVDRGPDSYGVVERVRIMCQDTGAIALRGNHEDLMLRYFHDKVLRFDRYDIWMMNGGHKTVDSYVRTTGVESRAQIFEAMARSGHIEFLESLPYWHEAATAFFSHAPVPVYEYRKGKPFGHPDLMTWSTHHDHPGVKEDAFACDQGKLAICGHVHALREGILEPRIYKHIVYADTGSGCADWGPLTAVLIENGKYTRHIQAKPTELNFQ